MAYASPWIDEELSILQDNVGRFLQRDLAPFRESWEDQGFVDRAAWLKAGEAGLCASVPEQYGGGGGDRGHGAVIIQEIGRAGLAGGFGPASWSAQASLRTTFWATATKLKSSDGCREWCAAKSSAPSPCPSLAQDQTFRGSPPRL
jgi:alkylation response protein AidB-like acyl-CoA dehydrogenase